jgi:thiamine biosynthesis lipoprotein
MSPSAASEAHRRVRPLLGTLVELTVRGLSSAALELAVSEAFAEIAEVHRLMSFHEADSELSRLNREAATRAFRVDRRTWEVLRLAREVAAASRGAFDPTIAPTLVRWGFLPAPAAPAPQESAAGWKAVRFLPGRRIRFLRPLWLDLGGIAKGYAVDRACEVLRAHGVRDFVVNAGGDLRVGETPETVYVRDPAAPGALRPLAIVREAAVATSAAYFARRRRRGGVVHPLVTPATRRPTLLASSVSVVAPNCATADALTKVVAVRGGLSPSLRRRFAADCLLLGPSR